MEIVGSDEQMACVGFALIKPEWTGWMEVTSGGSAKNDVPKVDPPAENATPVEKSSDVDHSPFCPTNWSSLSSNRTLNVVRVP